MFAFAIVFLTIIAKTLIFKLVCKFASHQVCKLKADARCEFIVVNCKENNLYKK